MGPASAEACSKWRGFVVPAAIDADIAEIHQDSGLLVGRPDAVGAFARALEHALTGLELPLRVQAAALDGFNIDQQTLGARRLGHLVGALEVFTRRAEIVHSLLRLR